MLQEKFTRTHQFLLVLVRQVVNTHVLFRELQLQEETTWDFFAYVRVRVIGETLLLTDSTLEHIVHPTHANLTRDLSKC